MNKSASRTIDILALLAATKKPLTQLEISQQLDFPKSSTYELIYTLLEKEIVEFDNEELKTFRLSFKIFEMGMSVLARTDLQTMARPFLENLSKAAGETVFLAVENAKTIVYLDRVEKNSSITSSVALGARRPMRCTALGKAILSTYCVKEVKEVWNAEEVKCAHTKNTIMEYGQLLADLRETRRRGYAVDAREMEDEIYCIAAPVYGREDKAIAAISVAALYLKMDERRVEELAQSITETALQISKRMGFCNNRLYFQKDSLADE